MNGETRKVVPERRRRGGHGRVLGQARNHDFGFLARSPNFGELAKTPNRRTALVPDGSPDLLNLL